MVQLSGKVGFYSGDGYHTLCQNVQRKCWIWFNFVLQHNAHQERSNISQSNVIPSNDVKYWRIETPLA